MEFIQAFDPASAAGWPAGTLTLANDADVLDPALQCADRTDVVLQFPKWTDGRAYSQAVLLRARRRYSGRLVASGDVLVDMLPLLRRCGFDAVQMRADQSREAALQALGLFEPLGRHYQTVPSERRSAP